MPSAVSGQDTVFSDDRHFGWQTMVPAAFTAEARSKRLDAALFTRKNGKPWDKETWNAPIAEVLASADLPAGVTAYTLRHSTITDLVTSGLPLLAVAQISDTSVEIIEQHYGHLNRSAATEALASLAL